MARKAPPVNPKTQAASAINALFGVSQGEQVASGLKLIEHDQIEVKAQPRTTFSAHEVSELASSIAQLRERGEGIEGSGILQPLLVTALSSPNGTARYRLVAGERRYRASQQAGLPLVPCLVVTMRNEAVLLAQLIENLQRQDLAPLEEAHAFQELQQEQSLSLRDIAKAVGKTLGYVTNRLGLLKMGADVQEMVFLRKNTLMHAQHIDAVANPILRKELIHAVVEDEASIKEVERRIAAFSASREALRVVPREVTTPVGTSLPSSTDSTTQSEPTRPQATKQVTPTRDQIPYPRDTPNGTDTSSIASCPINPRELLDQSVTPAVLLLDQALQKMDEIEWTPEGREELGQALKQIKSIVNKLEEQLEKRVG